MHFSAVNPDVGSVSWARVSREGHFGQETTTWLDPRRFNLHNIQASSDIGCAMLDIMVPPYDKYVTCRDSVIKDRVLTLLCFLLSLLQCKPGLSPFQDIGAKDGAQRAYRQDAGVYQI